MQPRLLQRGFLLTRAVEAPSGAGLPQDGKMAKMIFFTMCDRFFCPNECLTGGLVAKSTNVKHLAMIKAITFVITVVFMLLVFGPLGPTSLSPASTTRRRSLRTLTTSWSAARLGVCGGPGEVLGACPVVLPLFLAAVLAGLFQVCSGCALHQRLPGGVRCPGQVEGEGRGFA